MNTRLLRTILILPGNVLVVIPLAILWLTGWPEGPFLRPGDGLFWLGVVLAACGLFLAGWTMRLFSRAGESPAPWHESHTLIVEGPYAHVRNPMITSVVLMLSAEALVLQSWAIAIWAGAFFAANMVYFPLVEEKALARMLGEPYLKYKRNVPRWVPRLKPWRPD